MKEIVNGHHKYKAGYDLEKIGCLVVDVAGYLSVSVLVGILIVNIFGPVV